MVPRASSGKPMKASGKMVSRTTAPALLRAAAAFSAAVLVSACAVSHNSVRQIPIRGAALKLRSGCGLSMRNTAVSSAMSSIERSIKPIVSMLSAAGFSPALLKVL